MVKGFPAMLLLLSAMMLLLISPVLGETATYSATYEAPLCTSGDYTSGNPCTSASLLNSRYTSESNYYNSVDEAYEQTGGYSTSTYSVEQIVAWDTDGDGMLENGDTVQIQFDGICPEGDDLGLSLWYSLNPEDGNGATWTKIDSVDYDAGDVCLAGDYFDETATAGGFTGRSFTISGSPDYVAIRMSVDRDGTADITYGVGTPRPFDVDDLILQMYVAPTPPTIDSTSAANIGKTNVTLQSTFTYNDATEIEAYWVIDSVNQSSTNYTVGTSHDVTYTGLDWETEYDYQLCILSDLGGSPICSSVKQFTTTNRTLPYINIASAFDVGFTEASIGGTFFFEDYENITAYAVLDGVNQTQTLYASGVSQYHKEDFVGLDDDTEYDWDFCISGEFGEICEGGGSFTTDAYTPPYINIINAFDITNHEATLGATVFYGDYENLTLTYNFLTSEYTQSFDQEDEFDTSVYYTKNLTGLDYATTYNYSLDIIYIDPNGLGADDTWSQEYICTAGNGQHQLADEDGDEYFWSDLNSRRVTSSQECADLCNRYYGDPLLNNGSISEGQGCCYYVDNNPYDECFISGDGSSLSYQGGASTFYAQIMNDSVDVERTITGDIKNFTTEDAYIPFITTSGAINVAGTTATLTGTYYPYDYFNSTVPYFIIDGEDQENKTEVSVPTYDDNYNYQLDLTSLDTNTTYNYTFCVGYGLGWALLVCNDTKTFTTGFEPSVVFGTPTEINANDVKLHWTINFDGTTNVEYKFRDSGGDWIPAFDGVAKTYHWTELDAETNYTYYLQIKYDTNGDTFYLNTTEQQVTTYYENAFDDVWDTLFQGSSFAKILLGFVVVFGVIFLGVGAFGKYNIQISMVAILIFAIIGTVLASLMHLFSIFLLLIVILGSVLLMIAKNTLFGSDGGGR